jgi:hypothetical protein
VRGQSENKGRIYTTNPTRHVSIVDHKVAQCEISIHLGPAPERKKKLNNKGISFELSRVYSKFRDEN